MAVVIASDIGLRIAIVFESFLIALLAIYFFTNAFEYPALLTLPQPHLTILDILSIAQKCINRRETFL